MSILAAPAIAINPAAGYDACAYAVAIGPGASQYDQLGFACTVSDPAGRRVVYEWSHDEAGAVEYADFARGLLADGWRPVRLEFGRHSWVAPGAAVPEEALEIERDEVQAEEAWLAEAMAAHDCEGFGCPLCDDGHDLPHGALNGHAA
jgi:hypothetical protein